MSDDGTVLNMREPETMAFFRYAQWRGAIKMEMRGMRFRGGSVKAHAARHLGMSSRAKHADVLAELERRIEACKIVHNTGGVPG